MHALRLEVELDRLEPELATEAGLLVAAERNARERRVRHVDPDGAGLDPRGDAMAASGVAGPDAGHEPVLDVVRDPDRVLLVLERDHGHDRAEDLLLRDGHPAVDLREHGRRVERARPLLRLAAGDHLGSLLDALLDEPVHLAAVLLGDERADLRLLVEGIADLQRLRLLRELRDELVVDRPLDEHARARLATLACGVVDRPDRARDRRSRGRRRRRRCSGSCRRARA